MPRRVQDIVPNNRRSIRDIPLERNSIPAPIQPPEEKPRARRSATTESRSTSTAKSHATGEHRVGIHRAESDEDKSAHVPSVPPRVSKRRRTSRVWIWSLIGIIILIGASGYIASVYFSRATFTIVPTTVPVTVNSTYIAQNASSGSLSYELAAIKGSASSTVVATDGPRISTSAKGKVTIYNTFSAQSQRLIAGTRIADADGLVYRLASSIVVPGYTTSGGSIVPGSVSVAVTADQPGVEYNKPKSIDESLRIVAYKGTAKYDSMYARVTSDIVGGFVGTKKTISAGTLASTSAELQARITATLAQQIKEAIPAGYIMYPTAYVTSFSAPNVSGNDPRTATVSIQGTLHAVIFKKADLVSRIAGDQAVEQFSGFAYESPGLESLDFSIANTKDFSPDKKNTLIIKLKGEMMLVGSVPVDTLKSKLAGLSLVDTEAVLKKYKPIIEIEKSSGQVVPPWANVPSDPDRISIEVLTK